VGNYTATFTARNVAGSATEVVTMTVTDDTLPQFTSLGSAVFVVGDVGVFTLSAKLPTNDTAATLSETGVLPAGLIFTAGAGGTATIRGTPEAEAGGVYDLTITATAGANDGGLVTTQPFTLTVREAPSITSAASATFTIGQANAFTFITDATSYPVPSLLLTGLPAGLGLTFTDQHNGTATLTGDPPSGTAGTYTLTLTADNLAGSTSQTFTLRVQT
jgi:large repetitive protein